jgi:hypothetical protein
MEVIGVAAGIVGTSITFIGVFWTVVFGPRNLVDIMTARQEKPGGASAAVAPRAKTPRKTVQPAPQRPRFQRWLATTGDFVLDCWYAAEGLDWDTGPTLMEVTGIALRVALVGAPILAVAGVLFTGVGIVLENGSGALRVGLVLLVGFLAAVFAEFFLLGVIGLIAFFVSTLPDDVLDTYS